MKFLLQAVILFTLSLLRTTVSAQPIILSKPNQTYPIFDNSAILETKPGRVTIDSLLKYPDKYRFVAAKKTATAPNLHSDHWFRFEIRSELQTAVCLYSAQPLPSPATLYLVHNNQLEKKYTLGKEDATLNSAQPLRIRKVWPLLLQPNKAYVVYWHSVEPPKTVVTSPEGRLFSLFHTEDVFIGFYYGFALIIILYNLLLFARLKDLDHLLYATWVGLLAFQFGILFGYFYNWMPVYFGFFVKYLFQIGILTASTHILFGISFLQVRQLSPKLFWLGIGIISPMLFIGCAEVLFTFLTKEQIQLVSFLGFLLDILFTLIAGTLAIQKGFKAAWFYILGILIIFVGVLVIVLVSEGQLPTNFFTNNSVQLSSMAEIILFTLALSYKVNLLKKHQDEAIREQLRLTKENRQLIEHQKQELEKKVEQRTAELQESLTTLKSTQNQLIQKEKLASLGELTAGIAHEIQNPLNFVNNFSELSVDLILELLEERNKEQGKRDEELEKDLLNDLSQNQEKINLHGKRASSIVKGMLEHSRTTTGERQLTDINQLTDEYLRLSYHGLRAKESTFNSDYELVAATNLPKIKVVPQEIGRVLLNLINNAFYAVNERAKQGEPNYQPKVTVITKAADSQLEIRITDNGTGIPDNIKAKIFQPFFTTKPTGEGTGLGLSLAYDIVTKGHGGTLEVESKEGEGTTFIVNLPITI